MIIHDHKNVPPFPEGEEGINLEDFKYVYCNGL
jgi:hypothetical protein